MSEQHFNGIARIALGLDPLPKPSWPLDYPMIDNDVAVDAPVCLEHVRWADPCLGNRHDNPAPCRVVRTIECAEILRRHHNGETSIAQARQLLEHASAIAVVEIIEPQKAVF